MQLINIKKIFRVSLIILLVSSSSLSANESLPPPFDASFKIFKKGMEVAEMHRSLSRLDNGEFIYISETNSTGLASVFYKLHILEQSHWQLQDQQLKPLNYSYDHIKKKTKSHKQIVFDWKNNQANYVGNGKKLSFDLKTGMTDKLLYQINIMHDLKMGHQPATYTVVDGTKIKTYDFNYLGDEFIETPIGRFNTVKLVRHKSGKKGNTILWCAKELHYLPIKVENTDNNGAMTTAMINQLKGFLQIEENNLSAEHPK